MFTVREVSDMLNAIPDELPVEVVAHVSSRDGDMARIHFHKELVDGKWRMVAWAADWWKGTSIIKTLP